MVNSKTTIVFVSNDLNTSIINNWIIYKVSLVESYKIRLIWKLINLLMNEYVVTKIFADHKVVLNIYIFPHGFFLNRVTDFVK